MRSWNIELIERDKSASVMQLKMKNRFIRKWDAYGTVDVLNDESHFSFDVRKTIRLSMNREIQPRCVKSSVIENHFQNKFKEERFTSFSRHMCHWNLVVVVFHPLWICLASQTVNDGQNMKKSSFCLFDLGESFYLAVSLYDTNCIALPTST